MKREILEQALNEISDAHLQEAVKPRRRHTVRWVGAIAAILAAALLLHTVKLPVVIRAQAIATPDYRRSQQDPLSGGKDQRTATVKDTLDSRFFPVSSQIFLNTQGSENKIFSPVNGYLALAMLAETTGGTTRAEILEALGVPDLETLRSRVSALWETVYKDDGKEAAVLANSIWLDESLTYNQQVMDQLSSHYYASAYRSELGSKKASDALSAWLNQQTGGHLKKSAGTVSFPPQAVLTLASTVYLQSKWVDDFSSSKNTKGAFHGPDGDIACTFMNKKEYKTYYYWADSFGAVSLSLKNGCTMWFLLPDPDKTPGDILKDSQYLTTITKDPFDEAPNSKYLKVNLTIPKFDVRSSCDMAEGLQQMGITQVFRPDAADFSPALQSDFPICLTSAQQAARVTIDEKGVTASSYIESHGASSPAPPEEIIDFVVDRPFVFAITRNGLPLFTGIVSNPA